SISPVMARGLLCAVLLGGCLNFHSLEGRQCSGDLQCGDGLVCHRGACAKAGSFESLPLQLPQVASEGGLMISPAVIARDPARPGGDAATGLVDDVLVSRVGGKGELGAWQLAGRLPQPRARAGAALFDGRVWLVGGACSGTCASLRAALLEDGGVGAFEPLPP